MHFFSHKVVVITGGTDGIGRALVESLLEQGASVATCSRNHDKLYQLQIQYPQYPLHTLTCDVSKPEECQRFIDSTLQTFGKIDILINNAGVVDCGMALTYMDSPATTSATTYTVYMSSSNLTSSFGVNSTGNANALSFTAIEIAP